MHTVLTGLALAATLASEVEMKNDPRKSPPAKVEMQARGRAVDARRSAVTTGEKGKTEEKVPVVHRIKVLSVREVTGRCQ
jgi:hypothetical protein